MNGIIDGWVERLMDKWMIKRQMVEWMDREGWVMDGWMENCINGWMGD